MVVGLPRSYLQSPVPFLLILHIVLTAPLSVASFILIPMPPSTTTSTSVMLADDEVVASSMSEKLSDDPRSCILQVGVSTGRLCGVANSHLLANNCHSHDTALVMAMTDLFVDLYRTSESLDLNLVLAIQNKLILNCRKYPVELCKERRKIMETSFVKEYAWATWSCFLISCLMVG